VIGLDKDKDVERTSPEKSSRQLPRFLPALGLPSRPIVDGLFAHPHHGVSLCGLRADRVGRAGITVIVSEIAPVLAHVMAILGHLPRTRTGLPIVPQFLSVFAKVSLIPSDLTMIFSNVSPILTEVLPILPHLSSPHISVLRKRGLLHCRKRERQTAKPYPALFLHSFLLVKWVGPTDEA
jgi:hypothetical protein